MFKALRKLQKNQKGFTLVEVIVVAVIVAVLAAVAIPIYLNYIEDSRQNQAENIAGGAASFCGACESSGGTCDVTADPVSCDANDATFQVPEGYAVTETAAGVVQACYTDSDPSICSENTHKYK